MAPTLVQLIIEMAKTVKTAAVKGKQVKIPPTVTVRFYNANKKDQVLNKYKKLF